VLTKAIGLSIDQGDKLLNQALAAPFNEKGKIFATKYIHSLVSLENKLLKEESSFMCSIALLLSVPQKGSFSTIDM
jgi:hypothetical protein